MALKRSKRQPNDQLDLFGRDGNEHDHVDSIRIDGRGTLAGAPARRMVAEMERTGTLQQMLLEAEEKTKDEMDAIRRHLIQQGHTPLQAHDQAWEMVREKYILLPGEND